jgi:hypothetical protein
MVSIQKKSYLKINYLLSKADFWAFAKTRKLNVRDISYFKKIALNFSVFLVVDELQLLVKISVNNVENIEIVCFVVVNNELVTANIESDSVDDDFSAVNLRFRTFNIELSAGNKK